MPNCSCNSRCGCDFSTRAPRKPNLTDIAVVKKILADAFARTAERAHRAHDGLMSPEEISAADEKLIDWLSVTFAGGNPHYESAEGWNPEGLAEYLRLNLAGDIEKENMRRGDKAILFLAARLFLKRVYEYLAAWEGAHLRLIEAPTSSEAKRFIDWWSYLMTGAPHEELRGI